MNIEAMKRNDTNYPSQLKASLKILYDKYITFLNDDKSADHKWASALKYFQYVVRSVMSDPAFGIGQRGNSRGKLIYVPMGMGKTRLAVATALATIEIRPTVVMLPHSLQRNFMGTIDEVINIVYDESDHYRMKSLANDMFSYVSMDAYNSSDQMSRSGRKKATPSTRGLDGKMLIVDEAHNFFRAIINSGSDESNARKIYDMIMGAHNLRILFLTGTPASKDPFELVPCFNMLTGIDLLPTQYEIFYNLYVDKEHKTVRNRAKLSNRLMGLVSHVSHSVQSTSAKVRDDRWFPEEYPLVIEKIEMSEFQYKQYILAREKEVAEKEGDGGGFGGDRSMSAKALSLPGSEVESAGSYYVKSRMTSTFCPSREFLGVPIDKLPLEAFTKNASPKLSLISSRIDSSPGPALAYSQFVESALKPLGKYLEKLGYTPFVPNVHKKGGRADCSPLTFCISGIGGWNQEHLRTDLLRRGWAEKSAGETDVLDFAWGELSHFIKKDGVPGARYLKEFVSQKAQLKSVLDDSGNAVISKSKLYESVVSANNGVAKYLPKTVPLMSIKSLQKDQVIIAKKDGEWHRRGVAIISNDALLEKYKKEYGPDSVACDYIRNPMLYKGRKFHLRVYLLIYVFGGLGRAYYLSSPGSLKMLVSGAPYTNDQWDSPEVHLSGSEYTTEPAFWPEAILEEKIVNESIVTKATSELTNAMRSIARAAIIDARPYEDSPNGFDIYGADVMFDDGGHPWVLEINDKPGNNVSSEAWTHTHDLLSARIFRWILDCAILPHFGLGETPEPLCSGVCKFSKDRTLEKYASVLCSDHPIVIDGVPTNRKTMSIITGLITSEIRPQYMRITSAKRVGFDEIDDGVIARMIPHDDHIELIPSTIATSEEIKAVESLMMFIMYVRREKIRVSISGSYDGPSSDIGKKCGGLNLTFASSKSDMDRGELIRMMTEIGWHEFPLGSRKFVHFAWGENVAEAKGWGKDFTNQGAELKEAIDDRRKLVGKDSLYKLVESVSANASEYMPKTRLMSEASKVDDGEVFIVKLNRASLQMGIAVVDSTKTLMAAREKFKDNGVVCSYVRNPMLWRGRKFHIRVHLMGYAFGGIARVFIVGPTKMLTARNLYVDKSFDDDTIHLSGGRNSSEALWWPESLYPYVDPIIMDKAKKSFKEAVKTVGAAVASTTAPYEEARAAMNIYGIDMMIDDTGHAWILESNCHPILGLISRLAGWSEVSSREYSANVFGDILRCIVLPHFGITEFPEHVWIGPSADEGPLSKYVDVLSSGMINSIFLPCDGIAPSAVGNDHEMEAVQESINQFIIARSIPENNSIGGNGNVLPKLTYFVEETLQGLDTKDLIIKTLNSFEYWEQASDGDTASFCMTNSSGLRVGNGGIVFRKVLNGNGSINSGKEHSDMPIVVHTFCLVYSDGDGCTSTILPLRRVKANGNTYFWPGNYEAPSGTKDLVDRLVSEHLGSLSMPELGPSFGFADIVVGMQSDHTNAILMSVGTDVIFGDESWSWSFIKPYVRRFFANVIVDSVRAHFGLSPVHDDHITMVPIHADYLGLDELGWIVKKGKAFGSTRIIANDRINIINNDLNDDEKNKAIAVVKRIMRNRTGRFIVDVMENVINGHSYELTVAACGAPKGFTENMLINELSSRGWTQKDYGDECVHYCWSEILSGPSSGHDNYCKGFDTQKCALKSVIDNMKKMITNKTLIYDTMLEDSERGEFMPKTGLMKNVKSTDGKILIAKEEGKSAQEGIGMISSDEELSRLKSKFKDKGVISEYVKNPMLWDGKKFHIRVAILVYACGGICRVYKFPLKRVYVASLPYEEGNWDNEAIHLSGARYTSRGIFWPEDFEHCMDVHELGRLDGLVDRAAAAAVGPYVGSYPESACSYGLIGLDIMLDSDGHPWILEANGRPGIGSSSWKDWEIYKDYVPKHCFDSIISCAVLPHFGLSEWPTKNLLWMGNSRINGSLYHYVRALQGSNRISLRPIPTRTFGIFPSQFTVYTGDVPGEMVGIKLIDDKWVIDESMIPTNEVANALLGEIINARNYPGLINDKIGGGITDLIIDKTDNSFSSITTQHTPFMRGEHTIGALPDTYNPCGPMTFVSGGVPEEMGDKVLSDKLMSMGWIKQPTMSADEEVHFAWSELIGDAGVNGNWVAGFEQQHADLKSVIDDGKKVVTNKSNLSTSICSIPHGSDYLPKTIPMKELTRISPGEVYILKKEGASAQTGVMMVHSNETLNIAKQKYKDKGVACAYITNPMLWKGAKFHIRINLLVYTANGMTRIYRLPKRRVMTAKDKYTKGEWDSPNIHFTGGKYTTELIWWPESFVSEHMRAGDVRMESFTSEHAYDMDVLDKAIKSVNAALDIVSNAVGPHVGSYSESNSSFGLLGVDMMVDDEGRAWIVEVNGRPGTGGTNWPEWRKVAKDYREIYFGTLLDYAILPHFGLAPHPIENLSYCGSSRESKGREDRRTLAPYVDILQGNDWVHICPINNTDNEWVLMRGDRISGKIGAKFGMDKGKHSFELMEKNDGLNDKEMDAARELVKCSIRSRCYPKTVLFRTSGGSESRALNVKDKWEGVTYSMSGIGGMPHRWAHEELSKIGFVRMDNSPYVNFSWGELSYEDGPPHYQKIFTNQRADLKSILGDGKSCVTDKTKLYGTLGDKPYMPWTIPISELVITDGKPVIVKMNGGFHRRGVEVVSTNDQLRSYMEKYGNKAIACQYIDNPMLYDSKKFHARITMMVYICEGISRVSVYYDYQILAARKSYVRGDWSNAEIHLTGSEGCDKHLPWPMEGIDPIILEKCNRTISELLYDVGKSISGNTAPYDDSRGAFELFGLDVMFDETGQAYLLEVNSKIGLGWDWTWGVPEERFDDCGEIFFRWIFNDCVLPHFGLWSSDSNLGHFICVEKSPHCKTSLMKNLVSTPQLRLIKIHMASPEQISELIRIGEDPAVYSTIGSGVPWGSNKINDLICSSRKDSSRLRTNYYHWVCLDGNVCVGYVGARPILPDSNNGVFPGNSLQLRYFIGPNYRGKGFGTSAVSLATNALIAIFANGSSDGNGVRIYAVVDPKNVHSARIVSKIGFNKSGTTTIKGSVMNVWSYGFGKVGGKKIRGAGIHTIEINDTFPYRKLYMPPFADMVSRLITIKRSPPRSWKNRSNGRIAMVSRTFPEEYESTDSLTDWEAEPARILCNERGEKSPKKVWEEISNNYRGLTNYKEQRESVYAKSRGCNLFNVALGIYLLCGDYQNGLTPGNVRGSTSGDDLRLFPGDVLDPTAGWGDRLGISFICGSRSYTGFDTNPNLQPVYSALAKRYEACGLRLKWSIECKPFEQVDILSITSKFDTVFTSPPFFDKEMYTGQSTSTSIHAHQSDWYSGFYCELWRRSAIALRIGGRVLAYIPPGRMFDEANRVLLENGCVYVGAVGFVQTMGNDKRKNNTPSIRDTYIWKKERNQTAGRTAKQTNNQRQTIHRKKTRPIPRGKVGGESKKGSYAIISGEVSQEARSTIKEVFNSPENVHGEVIKAILVSKTGAEGLDLKNIREVHMIEPYWDMARSDQVKARASRMGSHDALPTEERDVKPYMYMSIANDGIRSKMPVANREASTIDEQFYDKSMEKYAINKAFRSLLSEVCDECDFYGYGNCRTCTPTNSPLFSDDPIKDIRLPDTCVTKKEEDVQVIPIELDGTTYWYEVDESSPVGYKFYEYRIDLGSHAPMSLSNPAVMKLLKLLEGK